MRFLWILITMLAAGMALPAAAATQVKEPSQFIVEVKGIVCSFCAYGARKNLARVDFLDRSKFKEGIIMETEKGAITAAIAQDKKIDFAKVFKAIKKGGYEILAIHLNLVGNPQKKDGSVILIHKYNNQEFSLVDDNGKAWDPKDFVRKEVSIQGVIPESILAKGRFAAAVPVTVKSVVEVPSSQKP